MKNTETKNKLLIYQYVKDYFCLDENSLGLFKHRLFYEPHINKEYTRIIGNAPDLRVRVDVDEDMRENFDKGWELFKDYFRSFVSSASVNYKEFRSNKMLYKKQSFKLKKAIIDYYLDNIQFLARDFSSFIYLIERELKNEGKIPKDANYLSTFYHGMYFTIPPFGEKNTLFLPKSTIKITDIIKKAIEEEVILRLEQIGTMKMPSNNKFQLVLSLNFADWFLSSTAESWTSCINLESGFSRAIWHGLPGLIGDKNRAMLYLTDGKKKNYKGIEVDRILSRSWVLTTRNYSNKTRFFFVKSYPSDIGIEKLANVYLHMDFLPPNTSFKGRYYAELLWHKTNINYVKHLSFIYQDNSIMMIAKRNKAQYEKGKYGYLKNYESDYHPIIFENGEFHGNYEYGFNYGGGLLELVKNNLKNYYCISDSDRSNSDEEMEAPNEHYTTGTATNVIWSIAGTNT